MHFKVGMKQTLLKKLTRLNTVKKFYSCLPICVLVFSSQSQAQVNGTTYIERPLNKAKIQQNIKPNLDDQAQLKAKIRQENDTPETLKSKDSQVKLFFKNRDLKKSLNMERTQGPRTGGGGNSCALMISQNTLKLMSILESNEDIQGLSITEKKKVLSVIPLVNFYLTDKLSKDKQKKDAKNYPHEKAIVVTNYFCNRSLTEVSGRSMGLLLHEYLGVAEVDDSTYSISGNFLETYSRISAVNLNLQQYLVAEAEKDIKGETSCFHGELLKTDKEMAELYGGRYTSLTNPSVNIVNAGWQVSRNMDNSCSADNPNSAILTCSATDKDTYIATIDMSYADSGSAGSLSAVFKIEKSTTITKKVKGENRWFAEGKDLLKETTEQIITCKKINLPE